MLKGKRISVVMPAYNEEESIYEVVTEFKNLECVDEVVVVDNNSTDKTAQIAENAGARVVKEEKQGYGFACMRALSEAKGDYIILIESDGTFDSNDIDKFLAYSRDFDFILGTRTSKDLLWEGANMGYFLKWGNWTLAKMIEILYNGPNLSDVGCTYRLIKKEVLEKIKNKFTVGGSHFSPEMIILAIKNKIRIIEIPVNYKPRRGTSKITGNTWNAFKVGLKMIKIIFLNKLR